MKTNKFIYTLALIVLSGSLLFTSCKKKQAFKDEDGQTSEDNRTAQTENDNAINDVNQVISDNALLHGKTSSPQTISSVLGNICGLTIDTTQRASGIILLNYSGISCNNRTRTGTIKLTFRNYPTVKWKNAGAEIQVDYIAYKITRTSVESH